MRKSAFDNYHSLIFYAVNGWWGGGVEKIMDVLYKFQDKYQPWNAELSTKKKYFLSLSCELPAYFSMKKI